MKKIAEQSKLHTNMKEYEAMYNLHMESTNFLLFGEPVEKNRYPLVSYTMGVFDFSDPANFTPTKFWIGKRLPRKLKKKWRKKYNIQHRSSHILEQALEIEVTYDKS